MAVCSKCGYYAVKFLTMIKKYKQRVWYIGAADDLQRQSTGDFLLNMHAGG